MAIFLMRMTIAKAFGLDDATRLEASRCYPDAHPVEPGRFSARFNSIAFVVTAADGMGGTDNGCPRRLLPWHRRPADAAWARCPRHVGLFQPLRLLPRIESGPIFRFSPIA
jgi:hypothetical protein